MNPLFYSNGSSAEFARQEIPTQGDLGVGHFTSFRARRISEALVALALDRHINRLQTAGEFFSKLNIRTPSPQEVLDTLSKATALFMEQTRNDARVRITCWKDRWDLTFAPLKVEHVIKAISLYPVRCVRPLPEFKTCSAISSVYANSVAIGQGFDEALLVDPDSTVRESGWGNFGWFCNSGVLHFASEGVLPGITEEVVRSLAASLSIEIERNSYSLDAVMENIQAGFITTGVRGLVEVSQLGDVKLALGYPPLQLLMKHFQDLEWWQKTGTAL